jgi:hypothetical protein
MPHTPRPNRPTTSYTPVPAAILLPATGTGGRPGRLRAGRLGVEATCRLVATYTRTGDRVADLDADPNTAAAVTWLDRQPLTVDIGDDATPPLSVPAAQLVIARLPRAGVHGLAGITAWMRHVREHLLAPGGYLIAIVTPTIRAGRYLDRATTVIAAAKAAGLSWQQQLLHIRTRLPEAEPTDTAAAATGSPLARGRHQRLHDDLFVLTQGGVDA